MKKSIIAVLLVYLILFSFYTQGKSFESRSKEKKHSKTKVSERPNTKPLVGYLKDGKWHFLDYNGKPLFEPMELLDVFGYSEGFFRVNISFQNKPRWAIIDLAGNITVISGINYLFNFHNGRALVMKIVKSQKDNDTTEGNQFFGYINYQGKLVIPLIYEDATEFSEGLAFVKNEQFRGFIDTNNRPVIKMENSAANKFKDGLADINDRQYRSGFMNRKGEIVIPIEYDVLEHFSEGLAFAIKDGKAGFINKKGEFEFFVDGYVSKPFSDGMTFVGKIFNKEMKWALINKKGEKITDYIFDDVKGFSEGVAPVLKGGRWYFIDTNGVEVLQNEYLYIDSFVDGLAWASIKNGKRGYINHNGEMVLELPEAEKYFDFRLNRKVY